MKRPALLLVSLLSLTASVTAHAQADVFFGPPESRVVFREEDPDRRFAKTQVARALAVGTEDPRCVQLLGGLFTLLAEAGPTFHKRDANFYLDPVLVHALGSQLSHARFPGNVYFVHMVRRVLIDQKLPAQWLEVANAVNRQVMTIDMGKLQFLAHGAKPVDSYFFTLPALRQRFDIEVVRATSAGKGDALAAFRDAYLDREVAWGALRLLDVAPPKPVRAAKGRKGQPPPAVDEGLIARLEVIEDGPDDSKLQLFGKDKKEKPTIIEARLADTQYMDVARLPKGTRLLVRGRFWAMSDDLKKLELRDALVFQDRDWSRGAILADPNVVAACPMAINELSGTAPVQPGGFGHRPGK